MLPRIPVPVAPCRDMKVTLDLIHLHISKDPTRLLADTLPGVCAGPGTASSTLRHDSPEAVLALLCPVLRELVHVMWVPPSRLPFQHVSRHDPVPGSVLHIHIDGAARHGDGHVNVDLEVLADSGVYRKVLLLDAVEVDAKLDPHEKDAGDRDEKGHCPTAGGADSIAGSGFR